MLRWEAQSFFFQRGHSRKACGSGEREGSLVMECTGPANSLPIPKDPDQGSASQRLEVSKTDPMPTNKETTPTLAASLGATKAMGLPLPDLFLPEKDFK
ncbi:hypothetical protein DSO57_1027080 [Entomophthora muscae]|uniref:Uncharacterized protein n=1 Tax=Entomophthora muscae TaxID=34485 RepID=A0ACC2SER1_9FUNG|nr:hypothetical protein DSO57_1027080 [Entomophthora muscae]